MTASKSRIDDIARRASRLPLAPLAGAMLGAAVALLCLMTPVWMLERFSVDAGLPAFLAAASPPLGMKARLILAILAGGAAFLFGAMVVSLLDRGTKPRPRKPTMIEEIIEPEAEDFPITRQRSFSAVDHEAERTPRPILATRELGVPMDDVVEEKPLTWATLEVEAAGDEPQAELPSLWSRTPVPEDEVNATVEAEEDDWLDLGAFPIADTCPEDQETAGPGGGQAQAASPVAAAETEEQSVPALMARLEAGLIKRGLSGPRLNGVGHSDMDRAGVAPMKVKAPLDMDSALRNALQELHRVAGRA